ncbi:NAD(P)-dependent oxidoreductase [Robertmurraya massiliosenegalensis]|uniref:NAD(P)-dependent oxidoreductase n=1 Tax=Robertmurraya massiliosenegalensis TaxID=1287657 RepID=UPI00030B6687|nr:DUF1932 domain-containing protein [Robertmurraya massiliosenegalensis]
MVTELKIGFIGFGEVARSISEGLGGQGHIKIFAYHYKGRNVSQAMLQTADKLGVMLMESEEQLANESDVIFNVTRADVAVDSAQKMLPFLTDAHLYIDLNSASPIIMQEMGELFNKKGKSFIDGVLMAPLPQTKHEVPILVSGKSAIKVADVLRPLGMNIEVIKGSPGTASSIKMIRSLFMKGFAALIIETFVAAKLSKDSYENVMESLKETLNTMSFDRLLDRFLTGTQQHAQRRVIEMEEAISYVSQLGMEPVMTKTTKELLQLISEKKKSANKDLNNTKDELFLFYKQVFHMEDNP